jgi:pimeloyl-ACP methyl ester carboxylesterase
VLQKLTEAMMSGDRDRAIRAGWEVNVSPAFAGEDEAYGLFVAGAMRRPVAVPVIMAQMQACMAHDTNARLGALRMPTLVIHGTVDQLLPVQNGHLLASRIEGSRLETFEDVGHLFFWEQPQRAADLVREHAAVRA